MAKQKSPEAILLENFEGSRNGTKLFRDMSNGEFVGYITAMTYSMDGNKIDGGLPDVLETARRLVSSGDMD